MDRRLTSFRRTDDSADREQEWLRRAREGDREAFGELVRLHRSRAFGWARSMTGDPHLAEDIVQEALVRAFLHLGTLIHESRFVPWLRNIVRNEVRMKMRRGGPFGRERPLSAVKWDEGSEKTESVDLEGILDILRLRRETVPVESNPETAVLRRETLDTIRLALRCLTPRERELFEAEFYRQLSPEEIAELLSMSRGNVYTSLHRVREKVRREGFRLTLQPYLQERKERGLMAKKKLPRPVVEGSWNSFAAALAGALRYMDGVSYGMTELMGYTGLAFRIHIHPGDVDVAGPTAYPWKRVLGKGLANIGIRMGYVGPEVPDYQPPNADETVEAIRRIHQTLDRGIPAIAWDLFIPEFGLIYGYDDERQVLDAVDFSRCGSLPYDRLGRGQLKELALITLEGREEVNPRDSLRGALEMVLDHALGKEPAMPGYIQGLAAYERWAEAFRSGEVDPFGNAYNAAVYSDARQYATHFLLIWSSNCPRLQAFPEEQVLLARAAVCYARASEALVRLRTLFPFPTGGDPKNPDHAREAVGLLTKAGEAEKQGVAVLRELLETMTDREVAG